MARAVAQAGRGLVVTGPSTLKPAVQRADRSDDVHRAQHAGRFNQQLDRGEVESARIFNSPHVLEVHLKDGSVEKFHWGGSAGIAIPPPEQALREHGVPYTVKQHLGSEYDPSSLALLIPLLGMVLLFLALPTKRRPSAAPAQPQAPSGA